MAPGKDCEGFLLPIMSIISSLVMCVIGFYGGCKAITSGGGGDNVWVWILA